MQMTTEIIDLETPRSGKAKLLTATTIKDDPSCPATPKSEKLKSEDASEESRIDMSEIPEYSERSTQITQSSDGQAEGTGEELPIPDQFTTDDTDIA